MKLNIPVRSIAPDGNSVIAESIHTRGNLWNPMVRKDGYECSTVHGMVRRWRRQVCFHSHTLTRLDFTSTSFSGKFLSDLCVKPEDVAMCDVVRVLRLAGNGAECFIPSDHSV